VFGRNPKPKVLATYRITSKKAIIYSLTKLLVEKLLSESLLDDCAAPGTGSCITNRAGARVAAQSQVVGASMNHYSTVVNAKATLQWNLGQKSPFGEAIFICKDVCQIADMTLSIEIASVVVF
jgi:hypothetical protein